MRYKLLKQVEKLVTAGKKSEKEKNKRNRIDRY